MVFLIIEYHLFLFQMIIYLFFLHKTHFFVIKKDIFYQIIAIEIKKNCKFAE